MSKSKLLFFLSIFLIATQAIAQNSTSSELDSVLTQLHQKDLFNGSIAISKNGEIVYSNSMGEQNGENFTLQTPMYLASVSEAMTASAVLSLVDDRKIGLDEPVGKYLSPWPYSGITVRHLLNQTSGLSFLTTIITYHDTTQGLSTEGLLELISKHTPKPAFEPGKRFAYDRSNYTLLGTIIEQVTGQSYKDVLNERVFKPAGLENAWVGPSEEINWISWISGDGDAVHASIEDLIVFDEAFWNGKLVSDELVRKSKTPPTLANGQKSQYVFGRFNNTDLYHTIGHFGEGSDSKAGLWRDTDTGTTYAILLSGEAIHRTGILTAAMKIWNGDAYELPEPRPETEIPENILAEHTGVYDSNLGQLHVTVDHGELLLEPEGTEASVALIPASENVFYFRQPDLTWKFIQDESGNTTGLMVQGQPKTLAEKVE